MSLQIFQMLELINSRLSNLENNISRIEEKLDYNISLSRNHLIRVKNGQDIDDSMILMGRPYNDLPPKRAYQIINNPDMDFMILDVSYGSISSQELLPGSIHIPLEELENRYLEIQNKTIPLLIISEVGLRSIKACEFLVQKGFFNINNISGGHQFWPSKDSQTITK